MEVYSYYRKTLHRIPTWDSRKCEGVWRAFLGFPFAHEEVQRCPGPLEDGGRLLLQRKFSTSKFQIPLPCFHVNKAVGEKSNLGNMFKVCKSE